MAATKIELNGALGRGIYTTISTRCLKHVEGKSLSMAGEYVQIYEKGKPHKLHRYLWIKEHGSIEEGKVLHHINGDKRDNRLENLEMTTYAHNMAAINKKSTNSSSNFKGVSFIPKTSKWGASITIEKKKTHIGNFDTELDAASAYDKVYIAIHKSANGSNGTLSQELVDEIKEIPEAFMPKSRNEDMMNIWRHSTKGFEVQFRQSDFQRYKYFLTLEEAKKYRDQCLVEWKELQQQKDAEFRSKPITRDENGVAIIPVKINKSKDVVYAKVDDEDYYDLAKITWVLNKNGYPISSKTLVMHVLIYQNHDRQGKNIDHINHDKLDNRRSNLRLVTPSQNNRNKRKREGCSSGFMGVTKQGKRWRATINVDGKQKNLGHFKDEEHAAMAYEMANQLMMQTV